MRTQVGRTATLVVRLALAAVFLSAGAAKFADANGLAAAIANYRVLPDALVVALAGILPVIELLVGVALLAGPCVQGAGLLGAMMLGTFAAAMAQAKLRGIDLDCGCFGAAVASQVSWAKVALNLVLGALAAWVAWVPQVPWREAFARLREPLVGGAVAAVMFTALSAHGSVVMALDLAALVRTSDAIVVGTGGPQAARWGAHGRLIVTDMQLRVDQVFKGTARPGDVLVVTRLGGKLDHLALQVPGEANFVPEERVIAFLERRDGEWRVVGMAQGVMHVDGQGEAATVRATGAGMELVVPSQDGSLAPTRAALATSRPLGEVLQAIRRLLPRTAH